MMFPKLTSISHNLLVITYPRSRDTPLFSGTDHFLFLPPIHFISFSLPYLLFSLLSSLFSLHSSLFTVRLTSLFTVRLTSLKQDQPTVYIFIVITSVSTSRHNCDLCIVYRRKREESYGPCPGKHNTSPHDKTQN